jgi:hypothetical protein
VRERQIGHRDERLDAADRLPDGNVVNGRRAPPFAQRVAGRFQRAQQQRALLGRQESVQ